ncbi:hypothetical protein C2S51_007391 [Perilla frutescens var. frutescens]|nr:hypothetical protein C2S51_007391 [Perilla frutescens var. frutescens]
MLESYDHEGRIDQQKRFDVALQRYTDPAKPYTDEEAFAFEEQINFVKARVIAVESRVPLSSTMAENTENERKSLPIYAYKKQLIQIVHDHQVLIIVGETGSGKTVQIPQWRDGTLGIGDCEETLGRQMGRELVMCENELGKTKLRVLGGRWSGLYSTSY